MAGSSGPNVWVNRILSFALGGLVVLAAMSLGAVAPVKTANEALTARVDELENGAGRLLAEGKAYLASASYENAERVLATLLEKQPGSAEAVEGKALIAGLQAATLVRDEKWAAALPGVRAAWEKTTAARLRADAEATRQKIEAGMAETLSTEWEQVRSRVRAEWESGEI